MMDNAGVARPPGRLSNRLLSYLATEACKADTQKKLRDVVDPVLAYCSKITRPYVLSIVTALVVILLCQSALLYKIVTLERKLSI